MPAPEKPPHLRRFFMPDRQLALQRIARAAIKDGAIGPWSAARPRGADDPTRPRRARRPAHRPWRLRPRIRCRPYGLARRPLWGKRSGTMHHDARCTMHDAQGTMHKARCTRHWAHGARCAAGGGAPCVVASTGPITPVGHRCAPVHRVKLGKQSASGPRTTCASSYFLNSNTVRQRAQKNTRQLNSVAGALSGQPLGRWPQLVMQPISRRGPCARGARQNRPRPATSAAGPIGPWSARPPRLPKAWR